MSAPVVDVANIYKSFELGDVLRDVSLSLSRGETLVIMGGSGTGKTVLLRCIAGLLRPDRGRIRLFGHNIERLEEEALLPLRRRLGYVFQGSALFDSQTVYENVAFPLREHTSLPTAEIRRRVVHFLGLVGLGEDVLTLLPSELSGGMRKRVGIARALIIEPELLLFDEPTAGLDPTNARIVGELIAQVGTGVCDTSIVVTHDVELTKTVADRVALLREGVVAFEGPVGSLLETDDPAVQAFLAGDAR